MKITVGQALGHAIDTDDAKKAGELAEFLRARGLDYLGILAMAQRLRPELTAERWDGLMYEADSGDSESP